MNYNQSLKELSVNEVKMIITEDFPFAIHNDIRSIDNKHFIMCKDGILEVSKSNVNGSQINKLHIWKGTDISALKIEKALMEEYLKTKQIAYIDLINHLQGTVETVLITHDDKFHADDVCAYAILKVVFYKHTLLRSRDKDVLAKGDIVFDVGGGKYDHHDTDKVYRVSGTPYASFGLIWKDYGKAYLQTRFKNTFKTEEEIEEAYLEFDKIFIEAIDAEDNGVNVVNNQDIQVTTISSAIASFNNSVEMNHWAKPEEVKYYQNNYFLQATDFATRLINNTIEGIANKIRSRKAVEEAFTNRKHPAVVVLDSSMPWEDTIWKLDVKEEVLFVVYPKPDGYYVQVVRKDNSSFDARKDLPKEWGGKRDEELSQIIGINDAIFCHTGLFLAGAKSKESIMKMIDIALNN